MKRIFTIVTVAVMLCMFASTSFAASAPKKANVQAQIDQLNQEIKNLKNQMAGPAAGDKGFVGALKDRIQIGGELQVQFLVPEQHHDKKWVNRAREHAEDDPHFNLDEFHLSVDAQLNKTLDMHGELEFTAGGVIIHESYLRGKGLPGNTWFKAGYMFPFIRPNRKTENYPLAGNAFWRGREAGIQAGGKPFAGKDTALLNSMYWRASYTDGLRLGTRDITEHDSGYTIYTDGNLGYENQERVGVGLGFDQPLGDLFGGEYDMGKLDLLCFHYFDRQPRIVKAPTDPYIVGDKTSERSGVRGTYTLGGLTLVGEIIDANDPSLERLAYYVQPSYKIKIPNGLFTYRDGEEKYVTAVEPIYRYNRLYNDLTTTNDTRTWSWEKHLFGLLVTVTDNVNLKIEYSHYSAAGADPSADELLLQLGVKF